MPVYDQSYKHWTGSFRSHAFRWWVITKYGIKTAFKKKAVRVLLTFSLLPFLAGGVFIYGLTHLGKVSTFIRQIGGPAPTAEMGQRVYEAEIEGDARAFLERLSQERIGSQGEPPQVRLFVPEGENSKKILAVARQTNTEIKRLIPPGVKPDFYNGYMKREFLFLFLLLLTVGAGLIAKDVRFNALQIYLAKPITGREYILGKLGVIAFLLTMVTLVPGIILFLLQAILLGDSLYIRTYWWVAAATAGYSLLIVFSGSLPILALSALSRNIPSAASGGAALFLLSPAVALVLRNSTRNDAYLLISFQHNWIRVGDKIFGLEGSFDAPWGWSLAILVGIMVLCAVVLVRRVRGVEVVK